MSDLNPNAHSTIACGTDTRAWPEEGDDIEWSIGCAAQMTVANLPKGATFDAASGTISWKPGLDQAGPFAITISDKVGTVTHISGTLLDHFDAIGNAPLVNRAAYLEEFGLPVFHLTWHSDEPMYCLDGVDRDAVPADIIVGGHAHSGAELRCRGATSLNYPKKSFTLKFSDDDPFHAPDALSQFDKRRRLSLTQTFDDNSQVRNRMAFELWNRLDPSHVKVDQGSAIVFIDSVYQGLYEVTDDIDDRLMGIRGFDDAGGLFKSTSAAANWKTTSLTGYEKDDGDPADDMSGLTKLLTWISTSTSASFEASIDTTLQTNTFFDWYILTDTILGNDNYNKNTYVYQPSKGDQRYFYVPWDLNGTLGQYWDTSRQPAQLTGRDDKATLAANGIWQMIASSPTLLARLDARFASMLAGPLNQNDVLALFDQMTTEVRSSALRDDRKWDATRRAYPTWSKRTDFTTFDTEVAYVRSWITTRWSYITPLYAH